MEIIEQLQGLEAINKYLYSEKWFASSGPHEIYVRYYSLPKHDHGTVELPVEPGVDVKFAGTPFRVLLLRISDQKYDSHFPWLVSDENGKPIILVEKLQRILQTSDYVVISTPIYSAGSQGYENASRAVDEFTGAMRAITGNNFLKEMAREASVNTQDGNMRTPTRTVWLPELCEGPFAKSEHWDEFKEILNAVEKLDQANRDRILLAFQLFEKAAREEAPSRFFLYWVSCEVVCNNYKPERMKSILSRAYDCRKGYIQNNLGFDRLYQLRTELFHGGMHHDLPQDVERYVQATFLDFVRAQTRLPCRRHIESLVQNGFDINRLDRNIGRANVATINGP